MASRTLHRAHLPLPSCPHFQISHTQRRNATFLRRPIRPYTFTQLTILSDGSSYLSRTTSPLPVYRSTKDSRNHPLWQPSLDSLRNVEQDEAGRLRAFREKFGRGWDLDSEAVEEQGIEGKEEGSLMDLISGSRAYESGSDENGKGEWEKVVKKREEEEVKMVTVKKDGVLIKVPVTNQRKK